MRNAVHKFVILCGTVLVLLRFYPSDSGGWISKLFWDDVIQTKIEAVSTRVILFLGLYDSGYQLFAANLASLAHAFAILLQVLAIALIFYILARWI
jgi:hypothetical protein